MTCYKPDYSTIRRQAVNRRMLNKIYEMLEMGNWESGLGVDEFISGDHRGRTSSWIKTKSPEMWEIDDDEIHIEEHTRFMLSGEYVQ